MKATLLQVKHLKTHFPLTKGLLLKRRAGTVKAVDGVDLELRQGEILGLVGESGCGKSTLAKTIMQLIPATEGAVRLADGDLTALSKKDLRRIRVDVQMIFQDPYASLNPRMTVFSALAEAIQARKTAPKSSLEALTKQMAELMEKAGLAPRHMKKYPHEFSGGQRQRIAIARALAPRPKLIIADEPVSALDVSIQAQILNLLSDLCRQMGLTMIFISHDLSAVRHIADRIGVMYLGKIVELGPAEELFNHPLHPYSEALLSAIPIPDPIREKERKRIILSGDPPSPVNPPAGCPFHTRCHRVQSPCRATPPILEEVVAGHESACHFAGDLAAERSPDFPYGG